MQLVFQRSKRLRAHNLRVAAPLIGGGGCRRAADEPFVHAAPGAANLTAAFPLHPINAAAAALEALRGGRRLHALTLETAHLPLCASASGACAVWEGASGRVVLHSGLLERMATFKGLPELLEAATQALVARLEPWRDPDAAADPIGGAWALGQRFAAAAAGALAAAAAAQVPLWFCIACPVILGLLAPFVFNLGLAAAAEELCAALELPAGECEDLWWAAFALALVLSLASAAPIVYLCRLPECARRRPSAAVAFAAQA